MVRSRTALAAWALAFGAIAGSGGSARASKLVTFEDIYNVQSEMPIYSGYAGLNWQNVEVMNVDWWLQDGNPVNGYVNGRTSGGQVAWVPQSYPAGPLTAVLRSSTPIAFTSAQLTSAWNDDLKVQVEGYLKGQLVGSKTFILNPDAPTLADLNFSSVDTVRMTASGGTIDPRFGFPSEANPALNFVIDDIVLGGGDPVPPPVPEPSTLAVAGLLIAGCWLRSRRSA